jgi:hypothetical protein
MSSESAAFLYQARFGKILIEVLPGGLPVQLFLKRNWTYIAGVAVAIWVVFTYFDSRDRPAPVSQPTRIAQPANPPLRALAQTADSSASAPSLHVSPEPSPEPAPPAQANAVTAKNGIAVGGDVSGSQLRVDAQGD